MMNVRFTPLSRAALTVLLSGCGGDLLVGEQRCYGEGVDCRSDAPTLDMPTAGDAIVWDVIPARSVEPTWINDQGVEFGEAQRQLARAPDGGVWLLRWSSGISELLRINAEGEPVELHRVNYLGQLSVDDELSPILLTQESGHVRRTILDPQGEVLDLLVGREPFVTPGNGPTLNIVMAGPQGRVRIAKYNAQDYYVAEYDPLGEMLWKQSEFRGVRLPSTVNTSYQAIALSDGSVALGLPKPGPLMDVGGRSVPIVSQGITLIGPDGNVRWDVPLTIGTTSSARLFPGSDGGVVFMTGLADYLQVTLFDRGGARVALWQGFRAGYHTVDGATLCADPAGDLYVLLHTGTRLKPEPTVCRLRASDPSAEVVCLSVSGTTPLEAQGGNFTLGAMVAPEPGAVVFAMVAHDPEYRALAAPLVRVDF